MSWMATFSELEAFMDRFLAAHRERFGGLPETDWDPDWPSPCQVGEPEDDRRIRWQPVRREPHGDFARLEEALETAFHPDIRAYYTTFWSEGMDARADDGGLFLLQVWNERDFERLQENLIGHALAKRQMRQPLTLFFATTDDPDLFLSVDNDSGRVLLERPGFKPLREIADSLPAFLHGLEPVVDTSPWS